ncbi:unnamed protein product, partial [Nippostrongylus brasiliensis]|uniref:Col_cuticle_N domain-containing protein n=1 Tax=Nippostrongylus brasiliensis TaxID=27835 RepID=A0A0N4XLP5_NIPBR
MTVTVKIVYCVAIFTAISTIMCIVFVGYLMNDINRFYSHTIEELAEFKSLANTAWEEMRPPPGAILRTKRQPFLQSISGQRFRQFQNLPDICNCGPRANVCPAGPP